MTTDSTLSNWLTTEEPPEQLNAEAGAVKSTSTDWFSDQPFIPTPVGKEPDPDLDVELRWSRQEITEELEMAVTAAHGDGTGNSAPASENDSERQAERSSTEVTADSPQATSAAAVKAETADQLKPAEAADESTVEQAPANTTGSVEAAETDESAVKQAPVDTAESAEADEDSQSTTAGGESGTEEDTGGGVFSWLRALYSETLKSLAGK